MEDNGKSGIFKFGAGLHLKGYKGSDSCLNIFNQFFCNKQKWGQKCVLGDSHDGGESVTMRDNKLVGGEYPRDKTMEMGQEKGGRM